MRKRADPMILGSEAHSYEQKFASYLMKKLPQI